MGIDAGFDFYPPLASDDEDGRDRWNSFFFAVQEKFESDPDVGLENGCLMFEAGERPSLPFDGTQFFRFSSKVSGPSGGRAEYFIKEVAAIAKVYFDERVYYWSENGGAPNVKYSWTEVSERRRICAGDEERPHLIPFSAVATAVLTGFEYVHVGMDGLRLKSATFPENEGYRIVQEHHGFRSVNCIKDWADCVQGYDEFRAYWATRVHNNCATINGSVFNVLKHLKENGVTKISVRVRSATTICTEVIEISSISTRMVGLTPHHVGSIVEPPFVSRVPPSPDGETFHEFLVGMAESNGVPVALDCSAAQYGLPRHVPYAVEEMVPYLRSLGTHRLLDDHEQGLSGGSSFVDAKVNRCTRWALDALSCYWKE